MRRSTVSLTRLAVFVTLGAPPLGCSSSSSGVADAGHVGITFPPFGHDATVLPDATREASRADAPIFDFDAGFDTGVDTDHDGGVDAGHDTAGDAMGADAPLSTDAPNADARATNDAGDATLHDSGADAAPDAHDASRDAGADATGCHLASDCPGTACAPATCSAGACGVEPAPDGTACNDGNACTAVDTCTAGVCGGAVCSVCSSTLSAFFGASTTGWNLNGNAAFDTGSQTLVLVDGTSVVETGTAIYKDAITVDSFGVSFQFKATTTSGRADGIAFMIETDGATAVGSGYGGFGVLGLHGFGVENDIFDSGPCDPGNGNHAGVDLFTSCATNGGVPSPLATSGDLYDPTLPNDGVGDIGDGLWRTETVELTNGAFSVTITDPAGTAIANANLQNVALPGFVSGTSYYFGFAAGSGSNGQASRLEIKNVAITFPTQRCL